MTDPATAKQIHVKASHSRCKLPARSKLSIKYLPSKHKMQIIDAHHDDYIMHIYTVGGVVGYHKACLVPFFTQVNI